MDAHWNKFNSQLYLYQFSSTLTTSPPKGRKQGLGKSCHLEGPRQTWRRVLREDEVEPGQMQGPAPGKEEQDQSGTVCLGSSSLEKSLGAAKPSKPLGHSQGFTDHLGLPASTQPHP